MTSTSPLSQTVINFCHIFSVIIAIIQIPLLIIIILLRTINKNKTEMTSFSIQLTIAAISNGISYLFPYYNPEIQVTFICKMQALIHILSFIMTVNMLCIYYLLNLLMFVNPIILTYNNAFVIIYLVHWLSTLVLGGFNYFGKPIAGKLEICRYDTNDIMPLVNTIYSSVVLFVTFVLFIIIQIIVCKKIKNASLKEETERYKNVIQYFIIVIMIVLIKVLSYFLKEKQSAMNVFYLVDRVWENLTSLLLIITLVIGKKGFIDLWEFMNSCKDRTYSSQNIQLNRLSKVSSFDDSSSDY